MTKFLTLLNNYVPSALIRFGVPIGIAFNQMPDGNQAFGLAFIITIIVYIKWGFKKIKLKISKNEDESLVDQNLTIYYGVVFIVAGGLFYWVSALALNIGITLVTIGGAQIAGILYDKNLTTK